jgi:hypothetical protein
MFYTDLLASEHENHTKHANTQCRHSAGFLKVESTCGNPRGLNGQLKTGTNLLSFKRQS